MVPKLGCISEALGELLENTIDVREVKYRFLFITYLLNQNLQEVGLGNLHFKRMPG